MCHMWATIHPCGHAGTDGNCCIAAPLANPETGHKSFCGRTTSRQDTAESTTPCIYSWCFYNGRPWTCCGCNTRVRQGLCPNEGCPKWQHFCCKDCTRERESGHDMRSPIPRRRELQAADLDFKNREGTPGSVISEDRVLAVLIAARLFESLFDFGDGIDHDLLNFGALGNSSWSPCGDAFVNPDLNKYCPSSNFGAENEMAKLCRNFDSAQVDVELHSGRACPMRECYYNGKPYRCCGTCKKVYNEGHCTEKSCNKYLRGCCKDCERLQPTEASTEDAAKDRARYDAWGTA
ncbi:hypothetical protein QBC43DRAFT_330884 [Cladorrhinum sp. PSN259]|nr:hypothetical protein QBC43DRAFT_330884 [Cladorrhinum sp. PSN259]